MKKTFILFLLTLLPLNIIAQQFFVFCPEFDVKTKVDAKGTAYLVIKDGREFGKKHKEKRQDCNSQETLELITSFVKGSFPYIKFILIDESQFNEEPKEDAITFKVELKQFDAYVKSYVWYANTDFQISVFDNRNDEEPVVVNSKGLGKFASIISKGQGRTAARNSFKTAFDRVLVIIENEMTEDAYTEKLNPSSKYAGLIKLKKLLDDGILTQEEFDNEKNKILNEN